MCYSTTSRPILKHDSALLHRTGILQPDFRSPAAATGLRLISRALVESGSPPPGCLCNLPFLDYLIAPVLHQTLHNVSITFRRSCKPRSAMDSPQLQSPGALQPVCRSGTAEDKRFDVPLSGRQAKFASCTLPLVGSLPGPTALQVGMATTSCFLIPGMLDLVCIRPGKGRVTSCCLTAQCDTPTSHNSCVKCLKALLFAI